MFLIECGHRSEVFINNLQDDFIRFVPSRFSCTPEELRTYFIPPELRESGDATVRVEYKEGKAIFYKELVVGVEEDAEDNDGNRTKIVTDTVQKLIEATAPLVPLAESWPYQTVNGRLVFKGIKLV